MELFLSIYMENKQFSTKIRLMFRKIIRNYKRVCTVFNIHEIYQIINNCYNNVLLF